MKDADFTARVMAACQLLKTNGYEDVAGLLASKELSKRRADAPKRKRKVVVGKYRGKRGQMWIDPALLAQGEVIDNG